MSTPVLDDLNCGSVARIRNLLTPVNADEAVRKDYVDGLIAALVVEPGTVTKYNGTGATGNVDIVTATFGTSNTPEYWIADVVLHNPAAFDQGAFLHMKGFACRGTGSAIVGQVTQLADSITGTPTLILVGAGSNVTLRLGLGAATNLSWRCRLRRVTWAQML